MGVSVARRSVEGKSLAIPSAIFAIKLAVAGATIIKSADLDSSICPISDSSFKSNKSVKTLLFDNAATDNGVTNSDAPVVITGVTIAPCFWSSLIS